MPLQKLERFTKEVSNLPDKPSISPSELKDLFDAAPEEVREYLNRLIDALMSVSNGDSGAHNIGVSPIIGVDGNNVYDMLESLKTQLDNVSVGQIKNTSLTANQSLIPTGNTGSIEQLISWLTNRIQKMTGNTNWYDPISELAKKKQEDWTHPTLLNGWSNYLNGFSRAGFKKSTVNRVHVKGFIKQGSITPGMVLFRLPQGYRPLEDEMVSASSYNGTTKQVATLTIKANGDVVIDYANGNHWLSLSGISFEAEQ